MAIRADMPSPLRVENPFKVGFLGALGAILAITLAGMLGTLSTVLTYVGAALFLALGIEPLIAWLERKGWPRPVALLVTVFGMLIIVGLIIWAIVPSVITQVNEISIRYGAIIGDLINSDVVGWLQSNFPMLDVQSMLAQAASWLQGNAASITGGVLQVGVGIVNGVFGGLIVFILTIYFVASMHTIKRVFYQLTPASKRGRIMNLGDQITDSVGKYVVGQITLGVINGVLTFIFLSIIGASMPMVFAVIAFCGSLIPMVGTITASTLIVIAQVFLMDPGSPVWWIAAIYYLVYMQVEAYVISPRIMSQAVSVPGSVVVIAALTGGTLLGLLGALIAIPVAASIIIIFRQVVIPAQNKR